MERVQTKRPLWTSLLPFAVWLLVGVLLNLLKVPNTVVFSVGVLTAWVAICATFGNRRWWER